MKRFIPAILAACCLLFITIPAFAVDGSITGGNGTGDNNSGSGQEPPHISPSAPTVGDSIFSSMADDFLEPEDFVAFDDESIAASSEMFKSSLGSMANIAIYGMLIIIGVFAVFEIIHAIV